MLKNRYVWILAECYYGFFGVFRFVLAGLLVFSHFRQFWAPQVISVLLTPFGSGDIAVMLFFIVSGFVISEALLCFYNNRVGAFLLNRSLRIYPPFIYALILSIVLHVVIALLGYEVMFWGGGFLDQWRWSTVWKNLFSVFDGRIPLAKENYYIFVRYVWAIVVEVQFYICMAFLFYLYMTWNNNRKKFYIAILAGFIMGLLILVNYMDGVLKFLSYVPFFLIGCVLYIVKDAKRYRLLFYTILVASIVMSFFHVYEKYEVNGLLLYFVLLAIFIYLVEVVSGDGKKYTKNIDQYLGNLSYPLYLNHFYIEILTYSITKDRQEQQCRISPYLLLEGELELL